jgi:hypothetical protein
VEVKTLGVVVEEVGRNMFFMDLIKIKFLIDPQFLSYQMNFSRDLCLEDLTRFFQ